MSGKLKWGACSEVGLVRQINEDSKFHEPPLFVVADGMGGHSAGDVASAMAIDEVTRQLGRSDSLSDAVHAANRAIFERASKNPELAGMGTTITALLTNDASAQIAHVGDSRAYLLRDGSLSRLTTDHTVVSRLVQQGRIMQEDADRHPQRSYLERALGVDSEVEVDVHVLDFAPRDRVLLCSDGLFGMIGDDLILEILSTERDPQRAAERLCEEAVHAGGSDNVTSIVVDFPSDLAPKTPVPGATAQPTTFAPRTDTGPLRDPAGTTGPIRVTGPPTTYQAAPEAALAEKPRRRGRAIFSLTLLLVALGAAAFAAKNWVNNSWYVGSEDGQVTIFKGPPEAVIGMELSNVAEKTDLAVSSLPEIYQVRLQEGINADSRADAERVVNDLRGNAAPSPEPSPSAEPAPEESPAAPPAA